MGHWMLGQNIPEFGTFGETIKSQMRMMFGEFIQASKVDELSGSMIVMYWLYAVTFMLIVIWILLNFFLAIVVDAFVEVKGDNQSNVIVRDFISDLFGVMWTCCVRTRRNWPKRQALLDFFQNVVDSLDNPDSGNMPKWLGDLETGEDGEKKTPTPTCSVSDLGTHFEGMSEEDVSSFIYYYFRKSPSILRKKSAHSCRMSAGGEDDNATKGDMQKRGWESVSAAKVAW
eukprot:CAMPEP_0179024992 /NCGR_PEP_ID=MMETSP0796-20121207/7743_1 /TAXON_ID=73915 /ORGANISM="Pyrodinium bahamense, Strain pbaha01" /LENGTH=228 /DNA_ID=CAMNT_0020720975 /DNA_START=1 /DNA_END=684 /DNA_ORIENTATION=+